MGRKSDSGDGATKQLIALTHPVRSAIWDWLAHNGPATSSMLARQFNLSSGLTSYHLRYLADKGLVREVEEKGTRRERWWDAESVELQMSASEAAVTAEEKDILTSQLDISEAQRNLAYWSRAWRTEDPAEIAWRSVSTSDQMMVKLSLEQMQELNYDIMALIQKWKKLGAIKSGERRRVQITLRAYPLDNADMLEGAPGRQPEAG